MRKFVSFLFLISVFVLNCIINETIAGNSSSKSFNKSSVYYHYFKEKIPLSIDGEQIAIKHRPPRKKIDLDSFGISPKEDFERKVGNNYSLRKFKSAKKRMEVLDAVTDIAKNKDVEFISPVFRTENNGKIIFKNTLKIGFKADTTEYVREQIISQVPGSIVQNRIWSNRPDVYVIRTNKKNSLEVLDIANHIAQLPEVEFAEPGMITSIKFHYMPNDPDFGYSWGLHNTGQKVTVIEDGSTRTYDGTPDIDMDAPEAWDITYGDPSIIVAVLDCGVDQNHPDIRQIPGNNFVDSDGDGIADPGNGGPVTEFDNHGTFVAGCISGENNTLGTVGSGLDCKIVSVRISQIENSDGNDLFDIDWAVDGLYWAFTAGAKITCSSWSTEYSGDLHNAFVITKNTYGMTHFAAVLNPKDDPVEDPRFPANCDSVIGVQAIYNTGARYGHPGSEVKLSAPGFAIYTTDRTGEDGNDPGDFTFKSGTSLACPYAAGVAALLLSVDNTLTPDQIEYILCDSATNLPLDPPDSGYDQDFGFGLVNAYEALQYVIPVSLTVTIEPPEAVADARWKLNTGPDTSWKESEETISGLEEGYIYVLSFNSVSSYAQPPSRGFTPDKGQNFETVTYAVSYGGVKVNISPQEANDAGAQWQVEGTGWLDSGQTQSGLSPGAYTIQFKPVDLWFAPEDTIVNVSGGMTTTQNSDYVEGASFQVFITPDVPDTARWRLTNGDDTNWKSSGEKIDLVYVGRNYLEFKNIPDWDELAIQEVNPVTGDNIRNVRFSYNPKKIIITGLNSDNQTDIPEDSNEYIGLSAGKYHNIAVKSDGSLIGWGKNDQGQCDTPSGTNYVAATAGGYHCLAIKSDGTLAAWGDNTYGQSNAPSGNNYIAVSAGEYHSIALKDDGSIVAWGKNDFGQANIPSGTFSKIDAGDYFNVAIKTDGNLHAWGNNDYGQCNIPSGSNYVGVSAGGSHTIAIKSDGSLSAWGQNTSGQCNVPAGNNYTAVSAGYKHSIALTTEISAVAWGENNDGQCDIPDGSNCSIIAAGGYHSVVLRHSLAKLGYYLEIWGRDSYGVTIPPSWDNYIAIAASSHYNIALKVDGSLVGWGDNSNGQVSVPAGNEYIGIATGYDHSMALKNDGSVTAWGSNSSGQCNVPAGNEYTAISGGWLHSIALKSDGSIVAWGDNSCDQSTAPSGNDYIAIDAGMLHGLALKADGSIVGWGDDRYNRLNIPAGNDYVAISAGGYHSLALKSDGSIVGWGGNSDGQITVPSGNDYVAIAAYGDHSLALKSDGSIVHWGRDDLGQISGDGKFPSNQRHFAIETGLYHGLSLIGYECKEDSDIDGDGIVNFKDFAILASYWLSCDGTCLTSCCDGADLNSDEIVDFDDLKIFADNWLENQNTILFLDFDNLGSVLPSEIAVRQGDWAIDTATDFEGKVLKSTGYGHNVIEILDVTPDNISIEFDFLISYGGLGDLNICLNSEFTTYPPTYGYDIGIYPDNSDNHEDRIMRFDDGIGQVLSMIANPGIVHGNEKHRLRIVRENEHIRVYLDYATVPYIEADDDLYHNGKIFIRTWYPTTIDNILIEQFNP